MTNPGVLISVVVPTHNRPDSIARCLDALSQQTLPRESFEVVVVDDGSRVPVRDVVATYEDRINVRLIEQPQQGPATARNTGAFAARGSQVAFTDDDCMPEAEWLSNLARRLARDPDVSVGGAIVNALPDNAFSVGSQLLVEYLYKYFNRSDDAATFLITSNVTFPAAGFRDVKGFDTSFPLAAAEDREICDRWLALNKRMIYADDAVVRHAHPLTLKKFCRQHYNYGRGAYYLQKARAKRGEGRLRVETLRFYAGLIAYPWHQLTGARAVAGCMIAALSQVVYIAGFFRERVVKRGTA